MGLHLLTSRAGIQCLSLSPSIPLVFFLFPLRLPLPMWDKKEEIFLHKIMPLLVIHPLRNFTCSFFPMITKGDEKKIGRKKKSWTYYSIWFGLNNRWMNLSIYLNLHSPPFSHETVLSHRKKRGYRRHDNKQVLLTNDMTVYLLHVRWLSPE